jgi:hypothetical protein
LESAVVAALQSNATLMARVKLAVDPETETTGAVRGAAVLAVEMDDLRSNEPTGAGRYLTQTEEAQLLLTLGLKAKREQAYREGWEIMAQVRSLLSGLMPTLATPGHTVCIPGLFHLETTPLGRDAASGVMAFASLYQVNLVYQQRI